MGVMGAARVLIATALTFAIAGFAQAQEAIRTTDAKVPRAGSWPGFSGTLNLNSPVVECPAGYFVSAIQGFKFGGSTTPETPLSELRYACHSDRKKGFAVRQTSNAVPREGSWPGFSGTRDLGSRTAKCPDDHFVTAIQGFRVSASPNSQMPLSELRYTCRSRAGNTAIRRLDTAVPRSRSWPGFQGTLDLNHEVVRCPNGYYVNAIQGFKLAQRISPQSPLFALRYSCAK
jgi:hypothetical protein